LRTGNRADQSDLESQHLPDQRGFTVKNNFIVEIEGPPTNCDVTRWSQFTDVRDIKKGMFQRLEARFENWLNP
jgi:hypothetical protein